MIQELVLGLRFRVTVFGVKARVRVRVYGYDYGYGYGGAGLRFMVTVVGVWAINIITACKPNDPNNAPSCWFPCRPHRSTTSV